MGFGEISHFLREMIVEPEKQVKHVRGPTTLLKMRRERVKSADDGSAVASLLIKLWGKNSPSTLRLVTRSPVLVSLSPLP